MRAAIAHTMQPFGDPGMLTPLAGIAFQLSACPSFVIFPTETPRQAVDAAHRRGRTSHTLGAGPRCSGVQSLPRDRPLPLGRTLFAGNATGHMKGGTR